MNREIKFRGKSIFGIHEWLYGSLLLLNGKSYICPDKEAAWNMTRYEVIPNTIGQFTGLLDNNGKEIYEHDYISIVYKYDDIGANCGVIPDQDCICEGEVVYMDQYSCFGLRLYKAEYPIEGSMEECPYLTISLFHFDLECDSIEVLNNIYDHPELIKEEDK